MEQKWRSSGECLRILRGCLWQKENQNPSKTPKPDIYLNLDVTVSAETEGHAKWPHGTVNSKMKFLLFSPPSFFPTSSLPISFPFLGGYMCICMWVYVYTCGASVWACIYIRGTGAWVCVCTVVQACEHVSGVRHWHLISFFISLHLVSWDRLSHWRQPLLVD